MSTTSHEAILQADRLASCVSHGIVWRLTIW